MEERKNNKNGRGSISPLNVPEEAFARLVIGEQGRMNLSCTWKRETVAMSFTVYKALETQDSQTREWVAEANVGFIKGGSPAKCKNGSTGQPPSPISIRPILPTEALKREKKKHRSED